MKEKEWVDRNWPLVLAGLIIFVMAFVIRNFQLPEAARQVTIGCVLVGPADDSGWNESHYKGLLRACETHECVLKVRQSVEEDEEHLFSVVDELAEEGVNVIYLTSSGYGAYAEDIARQYPRVTFFSVSGIGKEKNQTTYFARLYQMRYLAGVIAGAESRTGVLGYVAAMPNPQVNRNINAYAIGMRVAKPDAKLLVCFTGSWEDEEAERESVARLQEAGADVIAYQEEKHHVLDEAEKRGLFSIGFDNVHGDYSDRLLTATLYEWDVVYDKILGDYLSGRTHFSSGYWLGMEDGAVKLHAISPAVSEQTLFLARLAKQRVLARGVFAGVIYDNEGTLRCEERERIGDYELFTGMDWLVEGVEIYE